jgi:integrase
MHGSVITALDAYLRVRATVAGVDDHVFLTVGGRPMGLRTVHTAFHVILRKAGIAPDRPRRPRIHDLRHNSEFRIIPSAAVVSV